LSLFFNTISSAFTYEEGQAILRQAEMLPIGTHELFHIQ